MYPALLFEVVDGRLPSSWVLKAECLSEDSHRRQRLLLTYPEWAHDRAYYERLLDGEEAARRVFLARKAVIDQEAVVDLNELDKGDILLSGGAIDWFVSEMATLYPSVEARLASHRRLRGGTLSPIRFLVELLGWIWSALDGTPQDPDCAEAHSLIGYLCGSFATGGREVKEFIVAGIALSLPSMQKGKEGHLRLLDSGLREAVRLALSKGE